MSFRFSIIVPTCGRPSLQFTLQSIRNQELLAGDEILLVTDGAHPVAAELFRRSNLPGRCIQTERTDDFGGSQRNLGMRLARGDYLLFMDDDDKYTANAFALIRAALQTAPSRPHLFRMRYAVNNAILWTAPTLALGN